MTSPWSWPSSTDHVSTELGTVSRASISPPDWDSPPRGVAGDRGMVKVRALPREDPHVIELRVSGRRPLRLLVVPPAMSAARAEEAMLAAATPRHSYTAASILEVVAESRDHDEFDEWHDCGRVVVGPEPARAVVPAGGVSEASEGLAGPVAQGRQRAAGARGVR